MKFLRNGIAYLQRELKLARKEIRQGRFQRSMAALAGLGAVVTGFEAYLQHLRGAFKHWQMWTPVALTSPTLLAAGGSVLSRDAQKSFLPALQIVSLGWIVGGGIGFIYHLRGIRRLAGGFELGRYNLTFGPPVFAPLLITAIGVMGAMAEMLRPEKSEGAVEKKSEDEEGKDENAGVLDRKIAPDLVEEVAHGRFQAPLALLSCFYSGLTGGEAYFEHRQGSFSNKVMYAPLLLTPPMVASGAMAWRSRKVAGKPLAIISAANIGVGMAGLFFHARAISRMPGGFSNVRFNIAKGPPPLAPLLFTMVGTLGLVSSLLRRKGKK